MQAGLLARPLTKGRELVAYGAFRNIAINGNFSQNQRAVSGTVVLGAGVYGHDRWKAGAAGCTYTFAVVNGITFITITAGSLVQVIEAANVEGGVYGMSWLGTSQGKIGSGGFAASGARSGTQLSAVSFNIEFSTGTLANVQLEGNNITPFERRVFSVERALCRWYFRLFPIGALDFIGNNASAGQNNSYTVPMGEPMRATPTFNSGWTAVNVGAITASVNTASTLVLNAPNTAAGQWRITNNTVATLDAEL